MVSLLVEVWSYHFWCQRAMGDMHEKDPEEMCGMWHVAHIITLVTLDIYV